MGRRHARGGGTSGGGGSAHREAASGVGSGRLLQVAERLLPLADWGLRAASASEWAVWIATSVLCAGAYMRHGLPLATLYFLATAALCTVDPSLHSLQLLNLAAVVYDLSFELHRLYMLVSNRPLLMIAFSRPSI